MAEVVKVIADTVEAGGYGGVDEEDNDSEAASYSKKAELTADIEGKKQANWYRFHVNTDRNGRAGVATRVGNGKVMSFYKSRGDLERDILS